MTALPRRVIVDDTDPQVQYSGSDQWILMNLEEHGAPVPDIRPNGPSFQNTTHFTNVTTDTASLSFRFQGSSPQVYGTSILTAYECFIDGTSIGSTLGWPQPLTGPTVLENNDLLCDGARFTDEREHTLTLNLTTNTIRPTLWFDYITYVPTASAPLGSATVQVDRLDPAISYSPGNWSNDLTLYKLASFTRTSNSFLTFNFSGTSVSWVGYILRSPEVSSRPPSGTYSIDDGVPNLFTLDEFQGYSGDLSNHVFFTSPNLNPGTHTLKVINHGDSTTAPLMLNHLVVANNVSTGPPAVSTSSTVSPAASTSSPPAGRPDPPPPIGAIVGGSVGGVAALCLAGFLLWRRARRRRTTTSPFISPFNAIGPGPAMEQAGNRTPKVPHSHPPEPGPSFTGATPRARGPPGASPAKATHEDNGAGGATNEVVGPPPSYAVHLRSS